MVKLVGNAGIDLELKLEYIVECSKIYHGLSAINIKLLAYEYVYGFLKLIILKIRINYNVHLKIGS